VVSLSIAKLAAGTTLTAVSDIVQLVANFAVFATLAFLAYQIWDSRRVSSMVHAQAQSQAMNDFFLLLFSTDGLASLYRRGRQDPDSLSEEESARFFYACAALFSAHEHLFNACQAKVMPTGYFDAWDAGIKEDFKDEGLRRYWFEERLYYDIAFRDYVDKIMGSPVAP
jgi:hypothetical protein